MKAKELNLPTTNFMFHMILSVCHEINHMLVGAHSASERPQTPPDVASAGHENLESGESGSWWEAEAMGGIAWMFQDQTDPTTATLKTRQSGTPMLGNAVNHEATYKQIDKTYIAQFVSDTPGMFPPKPGMSIILATSVSLPEAVNTDSFS